MSNDRPPPGYKQTAIGLIPKDWEVASAEQICELVVDCKNRTPPFKNRTPPFVDSSDFAVVRTPNVRSGKFVYEDLRFTDEVSFCEWTARAIPKNGDILITREAPLGEVCLVPNNLKVCLGQRMMLYRPDPNKTSSTFFLYALMAPAVQSCLLRKIGGSTVGHAKVDDIRVLEVPFPPLPEQKSIAQTLSDIDALIAALEKTIAKKRAIKTATMQQLLTGKKRLPGFGEGKGYKESAIGVIPEDWEALRLGDIAPLQRGFDLPTSQLKKGDHPVVYSNGIMNYHSNFMVNSPGVVTGRSGTIGNVHYVSENYWPHNTALWVTEFKHSDPKYVYYLYKSVKLERFGSGSGVPTLNRNDVHDWVVAIPKIEEQRSIASVLSDMDAEIAAIEARLTKTQAIKQGMMQELLTGRTRLV